VIAVDLEARAEDLLADVADLEEIEEAANVEALIGDENDWLYTNSCFY
jgi:hypothetical protein